MCRHTINTTITLLPATSTKVYYLQRLKILKHRRVLLIGFWWLAKEVDGIIDLYQEKYNNLNVVLTGGDADFFSHHLVNTIHYEPNLLFKGLLAISEENG